MARQATWIMPDHKLKIEIDAAQIAEAFGEIRQDVEQALTDGVKLASSMAFTKANELANERLHQRREAYAKALSWNEISKGLWTVELDESAMWIEQGLPEHSMIPDLLRKNYKVNKKGEKYKVIPFDQGKAPSKLGEKGKQLQSQVKRELKARNIPYKKLELDSSGNPRLGLLHQIKDIQSEKPSKKAKHGALEGLSVYQTKDKTGNVRRDIMTFRVVKESHAADGRWYHPGLKPVNILDDVFQWVSNVFDNEILPEILSKFDK